MSKKQKITKFFHSTSRQTSASSSGGEGGDDTSVGTTEFKVIAGALIVDYAALMTLVFLL